MEDARKVLLKQIENTLYKNQDLGNVIDNDDFLTEVKGILENYRIEQGDLRYYNINQNNVEGYYVRNEDVDAFISIQAYNLDCAKAIANKILAPYRDYCPCCGHRWNDDSLTPGSSTEEPYVRGEPYKKQKDPFWCKNNRLIIYKYDGTKEVYDLEQNLKSRYVTVLNNYMLGTYAKGTLREMVVETMRVNKSHTRVILDIPDEHLNYVKKLLGADKYPNRLIDITQYEDRVHKQDEGGK